MYHRKRGRPGVLYGQENKEPSRWRLERILSESARKCRSESYLGIFCNYTPLRLVIFRTQNGVGRGHKNREAFFDYSCFPELQGSDGVQHVQVWKGGGGKEKKEPCPPPAWPYTHRRNFWKLGQVLTYHSFVLSHFSHVRFFVTLWTAACQAPLSMRFPRQEYWKSLPLPSPGDLPNSGIKPTSLVSPALAGRFFTTSATLSAAWYSSFLHGIMTWGCTSPRRGHSCTKWTVHSGVLDNS